MRRPPPLNFVLGPLVLSLAACEAPPEPDPPPRDEDSLQAEAQADTLDPWPHYHLARLYERRGSYDLAIGEYGAAINRLAPRSATRPVLDLGILHHRLGNPEPALRCYREVLATFPGDTRLLQTNPDFRHAALGAKALLTGPDDAARVEELHRRFVEELGGAEADWARGPTFLTPLRAEEEAEDQTVREETGNGRNRGNEDESRE